MNHQEIHPLRAAPCITLYPRTPSLHLAPWHRKSFEHPRALLRKPKVRQLEMVSGEKSTISQLQFNRAQKTVQNGCFLIHTLNKRGKS